jgi:hypothetical protein
MHQWICLTFKLRGWPTAKRDRSPESSITTGRKENAYRPVPLECRVRTDFVTPMKLRPNPSATLPRKAKSRQRQKTAEAAPLEQNVRSETLCMTQSNPKSFTKRACAVISSGATSNELTSSWATLSNIDCTEGAANPLSTASLPATYRQNSSTVRISDASLSGMSIL